MMSSQKSQFLLYRIRTHQDPKAFEELYKEHKVGLRRFLSLKLPTPQDADDALSTVFMRSWSYLQSAEVGHAGGLFFTIARTVVAEFYRGRKETISYDQNPEVSDTLSDAGRGQARVEVGGEIALLEKYLIELPDEQSTAIVLRYVEGLPVAEVALRIGKTENATQVMLHRTLKALRQKLEPKK